MKKNYILAKWLNNELSDMELAEFQASPDFEKYNKIKKHSSHLEVDEIDENKILGKILQHKKATPKIIPMYRKWIVRVAAIFILGLSITFVMKNFVPQTQTAEFGKTTTFSLPDNSEVVLNSGSEIEYKKWKWNANREIELEGEAYFKVAKGSRFEVKTNLGTVAVLGTQFNVKARKNRLDITCYEGRVKVNYEDTQLILTQGQNVIFENGIQTNTSINALKPEWIDHQIAFNKENISNLLDEVQRQYNIIIELHSKDTNALFTGKLPTNNLDVALQIIGTTYNLEVKKAAKNKIIFEQK
ncbi:FecR family protein [Flavobacterium cellulosilyticum]|uniref:FecR family protein n=1 Tax=Flavobacterium cellulosilyticum TaxID=2541731 RepID=A0A4R5CI24_9FLAO|nr:FecR family protein [Flavobacterium cellulosilyticum]TDD96982.1 FecR family protein [Flavobacterium cellulosilyticum]